MQDEILSGELARLCGVSPDTIRHYERVGVLPAAVRGANGYRRFPRQAVERVLLIRRAMAIGFSLEEMQRILRQRDGGTAPCRNVRALAGEKLEGLDRRIEELTALREELVRMIEEWDVRLAATQGDEPARLLEEPLEAGRSGQGAGGRRAEAVLFALKKR
jgi:DNA-binding transcriptional MerR regulator